MTYRHVSHAHPIWRRLDLSWNTYTKPRWHNTHWSISSINDWLSFSSQWSQNVSIRKYRPDSTFRYIVSLFHFRVLPWAKAPSRDTACQAQRWLGKKNSYSFTHFRNYEHLDLNNVRSISLPASRCCSPSEVSALFDSFGLRRVSSSFPKNPGHRCSDKVSKPARI
jgi:hypothetical protein